MSTGPRTVAASTLVTSALPVVVSREVHLTVTHLVVPGGARTGGEDIHTTVDSAREVFATAIGSHGVEITTGGPADSHQRAPQLAGRLVQPVSGRLGRLRAGRLPLERRDWAGLAVRRRPAFHGRTADRLDILVTTRPGEWPPASAARAGLREALSSVASQARDRGLVVTAIRSPSAGFTRDQWQATDPDDDPPLEGTDPHLARGINARVTVAFDDPTQDDRVGLLAAVLADADGHGWGLHVADRRYGALRGQWVCLRALTADPIDVSSDPAASLVPETFVGPSRSGSSAAVLDSLAGRPLLAFVGTGLDGVDVMHVLLEDPADRPRRPPGPPAGQTSWTVGPEPVDERYATPDTADYKVVRGSPIPAGDLSAATGQVPVWLQYEVRDLSHGDPEPEHFAGIIGLFDKQPEVLRTTVEYHRQRWVDARRRVRVERAKLALTLSLAEARAGQGSVPTTDQRLLDLCEAVQNQHLRRRTDGAGRGGRVANLRIAARERWLGSWLDDG